MFLCNDFSFHSCVFQSQFDSDFLDFISEQMEEADFLDGISVTPEAPFVGPVQVPVDPLDFSGSAGFFWIR